MMVVAVRIMVVVVMLVVVDSEGGGCAGGAGGSGGVGGSCAGCGGGPLFSLCRYGSPIPIFENQFYFHELNCLMSLYVFNVPFKLH